MNEGSRKMDVTTESGSRFSPGGRRVAKDLLLGDDPPEFLIVGIALMAVLLMFLVLASRSMECDDTMRISLMLKGGDATDGVHGLALIRREEAVRVCPGQTVRFALTSAGEYDRVYVEGRVRDISASTGDGFNLLRVDLATESLANGGIRDAVKAGASADARVVIRRVSLFDRIFERVRLLLGAGQQ